MASITRCMSVSDPVVAAEVGIACAENAGDRADDIASAPAMRQLDHHDTTRTGLRIQCRATSIASDVFPAPPGPTIVTSRSRPSNR